MDSVRPIICYSLILLLINFPLLSIHSDDADSSQQTQNEKIVENTDNDYNELKKPTAYPDRKTKADITIPTAYDWPPFKSDNPYRRVIVKLESQPLSKQKVLLQESRSGTDLFSYRMEDCYNRLKVEHSMFKNQLKFLGTEVEILWDYYNAYNGIGLVIEENYVNKLKSLPGVKGVYYDKVGYGSVMDSVKIINADEAWKLKNETGASLNGEGVVIAVLDTGIDYYHKDLGGDFGPSHKVIGGYDFVNKDSDPMDDNYHGTMVSGIIAASGSITGVAPNASLLAYKVSDENDNAWLTDTLAGLDRALDPDSNPGTNDSADIICISLAWFGTPYDTISEAVDNAYLAGSLPVVAAGNNGPDISTMRSPGTAYNALTVGATTKAEVIANISGRGPVGLGHVKPEIVAPGIDIFTTFPENSYGYLTGTSAAGPHVVGAAALLKQLHPDWGPKQLRAAIVNNGRDLNDPVVAQGGGMLDIEAAATSELSCTPDILAFETDMGDYIESTTAETVVLNNTGAASINVNIDISCYYTADFQLIELETPVEVNNYIIPSESSFSIPSASEKAIDFTLPLPASAAEGYYWGKIKFTSASDSINIPFGFRFVEFETDYGEWMINTDTKIVGKSIRCTNLTVTNSAKLELDNVRLYMNSKEDGLSLINIASGSSLHVNNCSIASYNPSIYYNFTLYGQGMIAHSKLSGMYGIYDSPFPGGINVYSDGSSVTNCSIFRCYTNGVFSDSVSNLLVADNHIHHNGGEGVLVWDSEDVSILRNNCSRNWWDGIGMTNTDARVYGNSIHYNSYDGIWVNNSSPEIAHNTITHSGYWMKHQDAAGIKFQRGSKPIMESNTFSDNKYYGFYINASSPDIWNSSISNSLEEDIYIVPYKGNHSKPRFVNSTYDSVFLPLTDLESEITRQWFLQVQVTDVTEEVVAGVLVKVVDNQGVEAASVLTDSKGLTPDLVLTQYVRTITKTEHKSPYRLEINKTSIKNNDITDIDLSSNLRINATLPIPDLLVTKVSVEPDPAFVSEPSNFTIFVFNNGTVDLTDVNLTCKFDGNASTLTSFSIDEINANSSANLTFSKTIPTPGSHRITTEVRLPSFFIERDYDNNIFDYNFTIYSRPTTSDLKILESHTYIHEPVTFEAVGDGGEGEIVAYQFRFSDGTITDWLANSTYGHVFSDLSFLYAEFRVRTDLNLTSNWSEPYWFQLIERHPSTGIKFSPDVGGTVKTTYQFSLSAQLESKSDIISSYYWTFGDGAFSDNKTPVHKYTDDGSYNVTLKITYSTDSGTVMFWRNIAVTNIQPEASFFPSSTSIMIGESITFNASTTRDFDDTEFDLEFQWQFGDDSTGTGMTVSHTYTEESIYLVILTVTDDDNATSTFTMEVTVKDQDAQKDDEPKGFELGNLTYAIIIIAVLLIILLAGIFVLFYTKSRWKPDVEEEAEEEE